MNGQTSIDLADLVRDPSKATSVDRGRIGALLTQLCALQGSLAAKLVADGSDGDEEDRLLSVDEAAERLGCSKDWLYRRSNRLPFIVRVGGKVKCSANGIERYIKNRVGR